VYIIYIRERYYFSPMCTFKKAIINFKVKVDVGANEVIGANYTATTPFLKPLLKF
jgi:hypothetical protein